MESTPVPCEPSTMTLAGDPESVPISAGPVNFPIQPGAAGSNISSSVIRSRRMVRGKGSPVYNSFVLGRNTSLTSNFPMPSVDSRGNRNPSSRQRRLLVMTSCSVTGRVSSQKDPKNQTVSYTYDALGRVLTTTERTGKVTTFEGGQRVPTVFWWPGTIPAGTTVTDMGSTLDQTATVAGLTGTNLPADRTLVSYDLTPALRGTGLVCVIYTFQVGRSTEAWQFKQNSMAFWAMAG
jgi:YD repeat-containing protein